MYTAKLVPVMKACMHILTGKTCFNHWENLLLLQGSCSHYREPVFKTGSSLHASFYRVQECSVCTDFIGTEGPRLTRILGLEKIRIMQNSR